MFPFSKVKYRSYKFSKKNNIIGNQEIIWKIEANF